MKSHQPAATAGHAYACCASIAKLEPEFESLVDKAIRAIVACDPKPDSISGILPKGELPG